MPVNVACALGAILAIAATIVLFILVLPKSKDGKLPNKFLQFLHDALNFKILFLESILKAIYVLLTCLCIFIGFFLLFSRVGYSYGYGYGYYTSTFLYGLVMLILGPILLRISYELLMLAIILVKNVIEINRKLKSSSDGSSQDEEAPPKPEPVYLYCTQCGTRYDVTQQSTCPNCGKNNTP